MNEPFDERQPPSKSARKRASAALQDLGDHLTGLSDAELDRLELPEALRNAVEQARDMRRGGGRKRLVKFIGKLLREMDEDARTALEHALAEQDRASDEARARLHRVERWRERLIEEGDEALSELLADQPAGDVQHLRQLIRNARRERERERPPKAARELFRYLRDELAV